jgi:hypothetical protein
MHPPHARTRIGLTMTNTPRLSIVVALTGLALLVSSRVLAGPKEEMEAISEPTTVAIEPIAATLLGGPSIEQVAGAGVQPDGHIVLFLNCWGPHLPPPIEEFDDVVTLGEQHRRWDPTVPVREKPEPGVETLRVNQRNPNPAGIIVRLSPKMGDIASVTRFAFGVARFGPAGSCRVGPDGSLYITGRGQPPLLDIAPPARGRSLAMEREDRAGYYDMLRAEREELRQQGIPRRELEPGVERVKREIAEAQGRTVYLAKLDSSGSEIEWTLFWDDISRAPNPAIEYGFDAEGHIIVRERFGLLRVSPDGRTVRWLNATLPVEHQNWVIDAASGRIFASGQVRTETGRAEGREFIESPYLSCIDATDGENWRAWGWSGTILGLECYRLLAPSRITGIFPQPHDRVVVAGSHVGNQTVFLRDVFDLDLRVMDGRDPLLAQVRYFRDTPSPTILIELDQQTKSISNATYFCAHLPAERRPWGHRAGRPTGIDLAQAIALPDGALLLSGAAPTGLPQTATNWHAVRPTQPYESGFTTILDATWSTMRFSSYVPAVPRIHASARGDVIVLYGDAVSVDSSRARPIERKSLQERHGGETDAWLMLISAPDAAPVPDVAQEGAVR